MGIFKLTLGEQSDRMKILFLSHAVKDGDLAVALAKELEILGYSTWYYEADSLPGQSYLLNTRIGISECSAFLLLVSNHSILSHQVDVELEHAHEKAKKVIPVLLGVNDEDYKEKNPKWAQIVGTSTSISISPTTVHPVAQRIARGLAAMGIPKGTATIIIDSEPPQEDPPPKISGEAKCKLERAVAKEILNAIKKVDQKVSWIERPVSREELPGADPNHFVTIGQRDYYLGEREKFHIPLPFWTGNSCEIILTISEQSYDKFSDMVQLLQEFETKFIEMKQAFDCSVGDSKIMAASAFEDLKAIYALIISKAPGIKAASERRIS